MDSSKRIPKGAVRTLGVMTLKKAGDFVEIWPILEESLKSSYKEEGMLDGEPFFKEGETAETATKVYVMSTWKDEAAVESHLKQPHVLKFFEDVKKFEIGIEITKFYSAAN